MSDPNVPVPPAVYPPSPANATGWTAYAPAPVQPVAAPPVEASVTVKRGLSLTSFILGLVAFVLSFALGAGFLVGLAAVIFGCVARKREPGAPKWMSLVGIIVGFVAIVLSLIVFVGFVLLFVVTSESSSRASLG